MITYERVHKVASEALQEADIDEALRMSIRRGDRFRNLIASLVGELNKAAKVVYKRRKVHLKQETLDDTVKDFVQCLIRSVIFEGDRSVESQAAKTLREEKKQEIQDMENTLDGKPSGVFEELGVEIVKDREEDFGQTNEVSSKVLHRDS